MATRKYKKNRRGEYVTKAWDGTYNPDGSKHRVNLISRKSSADLERMVSDMRQKVLHQGSVASSGVFFGDYSREWFSLSKATREKNTQKMYRTAVYNYLSPLDALPMSALRQSHLQQVINLHMDHPRTCMDIKSTFSQIVRSAVRDRLLPPAALSDLLTDISMPKYIRPERRPLTPLERDAFLRVDLDPRKQAYVSVLYYLGVRKEEALALSAKDFDFSRNLVHVRNVVIFDGNRPEIKPYPKSQRGIRDIPLPDPLLPRLLPFVDGNTDPYLFHGRDSDLMTDTAYRRMWESIITAMNRAAGWNPFAKKDRQPAPISGLTAHIFRHNYCTELCYQIPRISTKMIARLLGDDEKMVHEIYSHILAEREDVPGAISCAFPE